MTHKSTRNNSPTQKNNFDLFYDVVKTIPHGSVLTYGEVARLAGLPNHARQVGYALAALRDSKQYDIPWQRVINASYNISTRADEGAENMQRILLEEEGLVFDHKGKIIFDSSNKKTIK